MSEKITIRELAKLLECPVCLKHWDMGSVLLQCENGHSCCQACYSRLSKCPICRECLITEIKTISNEMIIVMKHELRHVETAGGTLSISNLLKFFRCFICNYFPIRHPTWQCVNGHLVCAECRVSTAAFCLCRLFIFEASSRSLFAQRVLELTAKPCRFTRHGCKAVITDLNQHEKEGCIYREVTCIFKRCKKLSPMIHLLGHLEELNPKHENLKIPLNLNFGEEPDRGCGFINLPSNWAEEIPYRSLDTINCLKLKNNTLIFMCWANGFKERCVFWVYCLSLPKDTKNIGFKLRLFNEESKKEIHITGPVVSVDVSHYNLICHPLSFKLSFKEIKEYWSQECIKLSWEAMVFEDKSVSEMNNLISVKIP